MPIRTLLALLLATPLCAHGGDCRFPMDVIPPPPPGYQLTRWTAWWDLHGPDFLLGSPVSSRFDAVARRSACDRLRALLAAADEPSSLRGAALVALARASEPGDDEVLALSGAALRTELWSAAVEALRASRSEVALGGLSALAMDTGRGRLAVGRDEVPLAARVQATYALALLARELGELRAQARAFAVLHVLMQEAECSELRIAAVVGLGSLFSEAPRSRPGRALVESCVRALFEHERMDYRETAAHVPTAVAALLGRDGPERARQEARKRFLARSRSELDVVRRGACLLALGRICGVEDRGMSRMLQAYRRQHPKNDARHLSLLALADIGGSSNREFLVRAVRSARSETDRQWAAIALGVYVRKLARPPGDSSREVSRIGDALSELLARRSGSTSDAAAIALGLCGDRRVAAELLAVGSKQLGLQYQALALMGHRDSLPVTRAAFERSGLHMDLVDWAVPAMAAIGGREELGVLLSLWSRYPTESHLADRLPRAMGRLAAVGDLQSFATTAGNHTVPAAQRAAFVAAIGHAFGGDVRPWWAELAPAINFASVPETLIGDGVPQGIR